jgi:hypothetical protein
MVWHGRRGESVAAVETIQDTVRQGTHAFTDADNLLRTPLLNANTLWYGTTILPALYNLMDQPYWRGLWVMQEISIAAAVGDIYIGNNRISRVELMVLLRSHIMGGGRQTANMMDDFRKRLTTGSRAT